jgi:3-phenylpropionate/trans-cinnamate dioxygenase ferredoxin subunit
MTEYLVGALADIPEDRGIAVQAGRSTVALFRRGKEVFAVSNTCPHKRASLCEGSWVPEEGVVRCPWHHWNWHVDTGRLEVDPRQGIRTYKVALDGDQVVLTV